MLKLIDINDGFTIVEVIIVLAVAALILLIIFFAVPALERASRNNEHKNAAVNIFQSYSDWLDQYGISNFGESGSYWYVDCGSGPDSTGSFCKTLKSSFGQYETNILAYGSTGAPPPPAPPQPVNNQLILSDFAQCTDDGSAAFTTSRPQDIVILYRLETPTGSGTVHCLGSTVSNPRIDFQ